MEYSSPRSASPFKNRFLWIPAALRLTAGIAQFSVGPEYWPAGDDLQNRSLIAFILQTSVLVAGSTEFERAVKSDLGESVSSNPSRSGALCRPGIHAQQELPNASCLYYAGISKAIETRRIASVVSTPSTYGGPDHRNEGKASASSACCLVLRKKGGSLVHVQPMSRTSTTRRVSKTGAKEPVEMRDIGEASGKRSVSNAHGRFSQQGKGLL